MPGICFRVLIMRRRWHKRKPRTCSAKRPHTHTRFGRWPLHTTHLECIFNSQSDTCNDRVTFKAHRLILAACSKHFQELFEGMPASPAGLIVILDGTSAHNMASLLEFMYRGEVHVSQESLSSFLKAAECLQVKGLSIEHEKLAVAQRHATENNNSSTDVGGAGGSSNGAGSSDNGDTGIGNASGNVDGSGNAAGNAVGGGVGDVSDMGEAGEATMVRNMMKRTPTPAPSPAPAYTVPSLYPHYYESPPKRLMRSPSDVDTLGRASVLRDGTAFRPASAPHPLLENHFYQPFIYPSETPAHPHTAPHTPTELEQELERARSEERSNCDLKESVAEDLRIKQEPVAMTDRERADKLAERLSGEVYSGGRGFDGGHYGSNSNHIQHGAQVGHAIVPLPPAHPPTPDLSPAPTTPAMWNTKLNKAGTVSTPDVAWPAIFFTSEVVLRWTARSNAQKESNDRRQRRREPPLGRIYRMLMDAQPADGTCSTLEPGPVGLSRLHGVNKVYKEDAGDGAATGNIFCSGEQITRRMTPRHDRVV
ncbi:unnamed protein product [Heterotrigona itama]|uniref:BTB domain-containing protein n=1 Tax=Heterotrigona itama TaxID=395501 RepID=A0A6V7HBK2_9HYME|nr:unnamed protein product [Heterotrigona itama]